MFDSGIFHRLGLKSKTPTGTPTENGSICRSRDRLRSPARSSKRELWYIFSYNLIFLNRNAPTTVINTVKPPMTARQTSGLI